MENNKNIGQSKNDLETQQSNSNSILSTQKEPTENLPRVKDRFYDNDGKLTGISILVAGGELPLTGEQFYQSFLQKCPE